MEIQGFLPQCVEHRWDGDTIIPTLWKLAQRDHLSLLPSAFQEQQCPLIALCPNMVQSVRLRSGSVDGNVAVYGMLGVTLNN
eukprot:451884-Amphidinium_carterae.1